MTCKDVILDLTSDRLSRCQVFLIVVVTPWYRVKAIAFSAKGKPKLDRAIVVNGVDITHGVPIVLAARNVAELSGKNCIRSS